MKSKVVYIKNSNINRDKWDECIKNSYNHLIYGLSWYLDCVCESWDGLVFGDYKAVMPLPYKSKFGLKYIYQPLFSQQLGIFSTFSLLNKDIVNFFNAIPLKFIFVQQKLNAKNDLYPLKKIIQITEMPTLMVNLYRPYEILFDDFSENTIRNIKKASKNDFTLKFDTDISDFIKLKECSSEIVTGDVAKKLNNLLFTIREKGFGECVGVYSDDTLIAGAFIVRSYNRFIYLVSASNEDAKEKRAMFFLINEFFKTHCEQKRSFDFEGSMIPGVAKFFEGFGAKPELYNFVSFKRFSFFIRNLKSLRFK